LLGSGTAPFPHKTPMEFGLPTRQIEEGTSKDVWVEGTGDSENRVASSTS